MLQSKHPGLLTEFEMACQKASELKMVHNKRRGNANEESDDDVDSGSAGKKMKQTKLTTPAVQLLTQQRVDSYVLVGFNFALLRVLGYSLHYINEFINLVRYCYYLSWFSS